jgi:hypothetical protein
MSFWQRCRNLHGWSGGLVEWIEGGTAYLSVVFSWQLARAYQRAAWLRAEGYRVRAGGPAVTLNPAYLSDVAEVGGDVDALRHHNPNATFTSRGCIRHCPFCAVPRIEGDLRELSDWEPKSVVCDNNLLACSRAHFDYVIDRLKSVPGVDFNQGLDARLLTAYHADRLAELDLACIRLAWDDSRYEMPFVHAFETLRRAGFPASLIRVYVLIGFNDTPDDALYRLEKVATLGALPNPMRYQLLDTARRNQYVGANWTNVELQRFMRYWSNLKNNGSIPFVEFGSKRQSMYSGNALALSFGTPEGEAAR